MSRLEQPFREAQAARKRSLGPKAFREPRAAVSHMSEWGVDSPAPVSP